MKTSRASIIRSMLPATALEIAAELDMDLHKVSAYLYQMTDAKKYRKPIMRTDRKVNGSWLWIDSVNSV